MSKISNEPFDFQQLLSSNTAAPAMLEKLQQLSARGMKSHDLVALVQTLLDHALPFPAVPEALDVCGTGGDGLDTPNISTAVALVTAACGIKTVKHGNRAASGRCGSADVLEALGVQLEVSPETSLQALHATNLCFLFARQYHPVLRHVAAARKAFGQRTIFNLAGPLANPTRPGRQLVGVYHADCLQPMVDALHLLGVRSAWVVHSRDGMDEISTLAPTDALCLRDGIISPLVIDPADYGLSLTDATALQGGDISHNAALLRRLLDGGPGPLQDIVVLNAAAALVIADHVPDLASGIATARQALTSGAARNTAQQLTKITRSADP